MKKVVLILTGMVLFCLPCFPAQAEEASFLKTLLAENAELPVDQSMANVGPLLFASEVLLPKAGESTPDEDGRSSVALMTAPDKDGKVWFYAYTDEAELLRVFPEGVEFIAMTFSAFVNSVQEKEDLGGIFLNSGSQESAFPVPAEFLKPIKME